MMQVSHNGIHSAYVEAGSGEPLVLVHGFTGSHLDFIDHLGWLAERHRVIAYDQRGHGESSHSETYQLDALVSDLMSLLDQLDITTCHILGHSLGGMVVMRAALAHPGRFRSLLLMDTAPYALNLFNARVRDKLAEMVLSGGCDVLLKGMQGMPQSAAIQRGIDYLGEAEHWRRIKLKLSQMDPQAFVQLSRSLEEQNNVLSELANLSLPTTVLVGAEDAPFLTPSKEMAAAIHDAALEIIPYAGHSPQFENADAWRAVLDRHLATS